MVSNTLNEIEQEMVSYLLDVDDMNYTMLCEPVFFGSKSTCMGEIVLERVGKSTCMGEIGLERVGKSTCMGEIELERVSYLVNVDDMNYSMLCETQIIRHRAGMTPDVSNIGGIEKLSLVDEVLSKEESLEPSMELIDTQCQLDFPKRKIHPLKPATLEDELAKDQSFSE